MLESSYRLATVKIYNPGRRICLGHVHLYGYLRTDVRFDKRVSMFHTIVVDESACSNR